MLKPQPDANLVRPPPPVAVQSGQPDPPMAGAAGQTMAVWFYTSLRHRQWGIFIASIFYALGWAIGVYRNF